jgi:hypothetical protein
MGARRARRPWSRTSSAARVRVSARAPSREVGSEPGPDVRAAEALLDGVFEAAGDVGEAAPPS